MVKGYFLLVDPQKNTLRISVDDEFLSDVFRNRDIFKNIQRHKTKKELDVEITNYLKGGGKDGQSQQN